MVAPGSDRHVTCCTFVICLSWGGRNIALHSHACPILFLQARLHVRS